MLKIRGVRILAAAAMAAAALGFAAPANAFYVVQWSNGAISYVCDNGNVYEQIGEPYGDFWIVGWYYGQPPC